jgi:hypothetical protein
MKKFKCVPIVRKEVQRVKIDKISTSVARFFVIQYQNGGKCTKSPLYYQTAINFASRGEPGPQG